MIIQSSISYPESSIKASIPDPLNIFDFGAKGDGVTDDRLAFMAAGTHVGRVVYVPWTENGYKLGGTIETHCRFIGIGKPELHMTLRGTDGDKGFWLQSNSGMENFRIYRGAETASGTGEFGNAILIGEHYTEGRLYENINVKNIDLIGVDAGAGRKLIVDVLGNVRDVHFENITGTGYISYLIQLHWGGIFEGTGPAWPVYASWHPRNITLHNIRMTEPLPDTAISCILLSGVHDIDIRNVYCDGVRTPITILAGDIGDLVAQGESVGRALSNIRIKGVTIKNYDREGISIYGISGLRANNTRWAGIQKNTNPSIHIEDVDIIRPEASGSLIVKESLSIRAMKNVEIKGLNIYDENEGSAENIPYGILIRQCRNIKLQGVVRTIWGTQIQRSRGIFIDTDDTCIVDTYPSDAYGTRILSTHHTATLREAAAKDDNILKIGTLDYDILPGTPIQIAENTFVFSTDAVIGLGEAVDIPITKLPVAVETGIAMTIHSDCENIRLSGTVNGFYLGVNINNSAGGGSAKSISINKNFVNSGLYDINAVRVRDLKVVNADFGNCNRLKRDTGRNIYLRNGCKGALIHGCSFENNVSSLTDVTYNIEYDPDCSGIIVSNNNFHNAKTYGVYQPTPTAGGMLPVITGNWFGNTIAIPVGPRTEFKTTTIGSQQIGYGVGMPTGGIWKRGDIIFRIYPAANTNAGWVCTQGGEPGTWLEFGTIAPQ